MTGTRPTFAACGEGCNGWTGGVAGGAVVGPRASEGTAGLADLDREQWRLRAGPRRGDERVDRVARKVREEHAAAAARDRVLRIHVQPRQRRRRHRPERVDLGP